MVVYEKKIETCFGQNNLTFKLKNKFSETTILKLFADQSEVSDLPAGCVQRTRRALWHFFCDTKYVYKTYKQYIQKFASNTIAKLN